MHKDSIANTFFIAIVLCLVCSTVVSLAAVGLRPLQLRNKLLDKKRNIVTVAGLAERRARGSEIEAIFASRIDVRIIDLQTGEDVTSQYENPAAFDQEAMANTREGRITLSRQDDVAGIRFHEKHSQVFVVKTSETDPTPLVYIFPVRGKGLWSILKGFLAVESDLHTIRGLTYYEHAETPGLGGEVDNENWKRHWEGRQLFDDQGEVAVRLVKVWESEDLQTVEALAGATITSDGVEDMIRFWMGPNGFGPYLERIRRQNTVSPPSNMGDRDG